MRLKMLVLVGAALVIGGCNAQRPLPMVKDMGDRAFKRGEYEAARVEYKEYVQRKPGEAEVQLAYAKTLIALNDPAAAVEHSAIAFDQMPESEDAIETRAQALAGAGQTEELFRFLRGLADGRGSTGDYIRLGRYSAKLGDADGAEHALLTAARVDGGKTLAPQMALANFYAGIGDTANEKQRLRMALYLDPVNDEVNRRLRALGEIPGPSLALPPK